MHNAQCTMHNWAAPFATSRCSSSVRLIVHCALCIVHLFVATSCFAQDDDIKELKQDKKEEFEKIPIVFYKKRQKEWYMGDSIDVIVMPEFPVYSRPVEFKNARAKRKYDRMVRNVKRVLPIAKQANTMIRETYEVLKNIPDEKGKERHMKAVEKSVKKQFTPLMKQLTFSQGKLLIKLIDRECNQSSYKVIKAFFGPGKAAFYQVFAWTFGASLKKEYKPEDDDAMIERIVEQVELGLL